MTVASTALARAEGRRSGRCGGEELLSEVSVSGVVGTCAGRVFGGGGRGHIPHKLPYPDRIYRHYDKFGARCCQTTRKRTRKGAPANDSHPPSLRRPRGGRSERR